MAGRRLPMSKQEEIQRLKQLGLKKKAVARVLCCSINTVKRYWGEPGTVTTTPPAPGWVGDLDWKEIGAELARGTTVYVLWEELFQAGRIFVQYPGFWKQVQRYCPNLPKTMHRVFAPASRCEIDYGTGIDLLDPATGELISTHLFVGVLCFSRYVFAEFSLSQTSADFLSSHVRMFEWFGGVPHSLAPDNLKSAVTRAHAYEPVINPAYTRLAAHYEVAVVPARAARPKDKALVERTVQIFKRWFYHRVRHRTFTSLVELNQALREHLDLFHAKKHRIFRRTRVEMFVDEKPHLKALPEVPYRVMTHAKARLHPDCHLSFDGNFYSAPSALRGKEIDIWATATTVEIYSNNERVALHARCKTRGKFVTDKRHYPPEHQAYLEATPSWVREQAAKVGPETARLIATLLGGPYPLERLRSALGIVRLARAHGADRLEAACRKANELEQTRYRFVESLIRLPGLTNRPIPRIERGPNPHLRGDTLFN
jgi:transposase